MSSLDVGAADFKATVLLPASTHGTTPTVASPSILDAARAILHTAQVCTIAAREGRRTNARSETAKSHGINDLRGMLKTWDFPRKEIGRASCRERV